MRTAALLAVVAPVIAALVSCVGDDPGTGTTPTTTPEGGSGTDANVGPTPDSGGGNDSGGGQDSGDPDSGPPPADVDGEVVDSFGKKIESAKVRIGTTIVTTGLDGKFHFALVPATYDLDVVTPSSGGGKEITSFRGLTLRAPKANVDNAVVSVVKQAAVSGTFTPALTYTTNEHMKIVDVEQYFGFAQPTVQADPPQGATFSGGVGAVWFGGDPSPPNPLQFWAYKFIASSVDGTPTSFTGFRGKQFTVTAGTPITNYDIDFVAITSAALSGTVSTLPVGAANASVDLVVKGGTDQFGNYISGASGVTNAFSIVTPNLVSLFFNAVANAGTSSGGVTSQYKVWKANQAANATNVALAFGTAPTFTAPANAATGIANTQAFSWTAGTPAGVYMVTIKCGTGATGYRARIFTTATSAVPSNVSTLGADWPVGASCTWDLTLYGTITLVNSVASFNGRNKLDRPNGPVDGNLMTTTGFGFNTPQ